MNKIARSVTAAFALVLVAGALSACADLESRKSASDTSAQRQADQASYDARQANRSAGTASHK